MVKVLGIGDNTELYSHTGHILKRLSALHFLKNKDIAASMKEAAAFAAKSCLVEGSFGYGVPYN